jgi:uncharacterized protein (TIGR02300 family)
LAKTEWGLKRVCPSCGARYYDMHHDPVTCPKCGAAYDPETVAKTRRARPVPVPEEPVATEEVEGEDEAETPAVEGGEESEEEAEEEEVIEDASELGEDEDDMAEVIENVEDEEER